MAHQLAVNAPLGISQTQCEVVIESRTDRAAAKLDVRFGDVPNLPV